MASMTQVVTPCTAVSRRPIVFPRVAEEPPFSRPAPGLAHARAFPLDPWFYFSPPQMSESIGKVYESQGKY